MYRTLESLVIAILVLNTIVSNTFAESTFQNQFTSTPKEFNNQKKNMDVFYGKDTLASGIRSRFVENVNGLKIHILEAGFEEKDRPCILLLHGFPELAYSWRKVMIPLAKEGYYVLPRWY